MYVEETIQEYECQEVRIIGGYLGGWLLYSGYVILALEEEISQ